MDTKLNLENEEKNGKPRKWLGLCIVALLAVLCGIIITDCYSEFRENAGIAPDGSFAAEEKTAEETGLLDERGLFVVDTDYLNYLSSAVYYLDFWTTPDTPEEEYFLPGETITEENMQLFSEYRQALMDAMYERIERMGMDGMCYYTNGNEMVYSNGPWLEVVAGESIITSETEREEAKQLYEAGIVISYDMAGTPRVVESWNMDFHEQALLNALEGKAFRELLLINDVLYDDTSEMAGDADEIIADVTVPVIKNKVFVFAIGNPEVIWQSGNDYYEKLPDILSSGYLIGVIVIAAVMVMAALILQNVKALGLRDSLLFKLPLEICIVIGGFLLIYWIDYLLSDMAIDTMTDIMPEALRVLGVGAGSLGTATNALLVLLWTVFALSVYWAVASVLPYITHPIRTFLQRSIVVTMLRWLGSVCKEKAVSIKGWIKKQTKEISLGKKLEGALALAALANTIVFLVLYYSGSWWCGNFVRNSFMTGVLIPLAMMMYNLGIYLIARVMTDKVLKDYHRLYEKTKRVAGGNFEKAETESLGVYEELGKQLDTIEEGFKNAVAEEVKSKNMKTELITNVSHDLKTPLTAIITYIELLKKEENTDEERREYLSVLEQKSHRLKVLIEDLFEVSKAESDNIVLNYANVDLVSLLKEVALENEMKISESTLDVRWDFETEKCVLLLDSARTYRIMDNLLQNALKYAMPGTRVYIALKEENGGVGVSFKNISATEMNFTPEEITERFVRGDLSRNSEGSGLGLAIAQSFTQLQGGKFRVETDGDLFKVHLWWPKDGIPQEEI